MRRTVNILIVSALTAAAAAVPTGLTAPAAAQDAKSGLARWDPARGLLIEGATVVTMDDRHTVVPHGSVLVRDGRIVAVWSDPNPPARVAIGDASCSGL
jgi:hypothetical protein